MHRDVSRSNAQFSAQKTTSMQHTEATDLFGFLWQWRCISQA
eukprot:SAG31_NODE_36474_length_313_cov_0.668224_1_plen_41_part_01